MSGLPTELHPRIREALLRCSCFGSDRELNALFADERLAPWRNQIPDNTPNREARVNTLIDDLHDQADAEGHNALALFLSILAGHCDPADSLHVELHNLAIELDPTIPRLESPPLSQAPSPDTQQKRTKDTKNLKWLMSKVHIPTLQNHIEELPDKLYDKIFPFWENFSAVIDDYRFHLYDQEALNLVREVHKAWQDTLSFYRCYRTVPAGRYFYFFTPPWTPDNVSDIEQAEKDYAAVDALRQQLAIALRSLLTYIQENYVDIDLHELSVAAWNEYVDVNRSIEQAFLSANHDLHDDQN